MATNHEVGSSILSGCKSFGRLPGLFFCMKLHQLRPLSLALLVTAFDGAWAVQALAVTRVDAVSNVELVSVIIWSFVHLPAALLAGAVLKPLGWMPADPKQMPVAALWVMAGMGLMQTFALTYGVWAWWQGRHGKLGAR